MEGDSIEEMPPLVLDIYDKDLLGNDFIARSVIPISEAKKSFDDVPIEP
jgi:hypothetical protein